eukprot:CAMPEP_0181428250 /NCGR_PEP_ID=MMETSP1110-20121109/16583_1 /TAXON_ID=174948 /ORGANISM="Symbiodinium sp., Strain CCMP421" /LENGTH=48 /DNA_ID= /DNA_START= /DNA_END= /DNA_ORIENTATION=
MALDAPFAFIPVASPIATSTPSHASTSAPRRIGGTASVAATALAVGAV